MSGLDYFDTVHFKTTMISFILIGIAGGLYAMVSAIGFGDNNDQWKNKYKQPLEPAKSLYSRIVGNAYAEKFPLSSSLLVSLTDSFHKWQLLFKVAIVSAVYFYRPVWGIVDPVVMFVTFGLTFSIVFRLARK